MTVNLFHVSRQRELTELNVNHLTEHKKISNTVTKMRNCTQSMKTEKSYTADLFLLSIEHYFKITVSSPAATKTVTKSMFESGNLNLNVFY